MNGCHTCGGYGGHHDPVAHGTAGDDEWYGDYPPRECNHENGECHDIEHQK